MIALRIAVAALTALAAVEPTSYALASEEDPTLNECEEPFYAGKSEEALPRCEHALEVARRAGRRQSEEYALWYLGTIRYRLGEYEEAMRLQQQAIAVAREIGDTSGEADCNAAMGTVREEQGRYEEAIRFGELALAGHRAAGNRTEEAVDLNNLATAQADLSRYPEALANLGRALEIARSDGNRVAEAAMLQNMGALWRHLGDYERSLEYLARSLPVRREVGDKRGEGITLDSMGVTHSRLGRHAEALARYEQALAVFEAERDRNNQALSLLRSADAMRSLGRHAEALERYRRARDLFRELDDAPYQARALAGMGATLRGLDHPGDAVGPQEEALLMLREVHDLEGEQATLQELMATWAAMGRPGLAIFFGKQAVNVAQQVRAELRALDRDAQRTYLASIEATYRALGDLLLGEGRLPEAEQVLGLLREEEFGSVFEGAGEAPGSRQVALTRREERAAEWYRAATRSSLEQLRESFRAGDAALDRPATLPDDPALRAELRRLGPGAVAVYTLPSRERTHLLLVTAAGRVAREVAVPRAEVARAVLAFREVVQDPSRDPVPAARALYRILVEPIERDLAAARATTVLWSLDGVLRYVPVAALHDGNGWLVERFRTAVLPGRSPARAGSPPRPLSAWAFGVTRGTAGFSALPGVAAELRDIVGGRGAPGGVLPGRALVDQAFTREAMIAALRAEPRPVVHIASHFRFEPGVPAESFLLLGDGSRLTLRELAGFPGLFEGVEVVSLSACETAVSSGEDGGRELDGFAAVAQRLGARAVLATLWPVEDQSTRRVMTAFYRLRRGGSASADALRSAQLALLERPAAARVTLARRGAVPVRRLALAATMGGGYSHPYYWAPFVLAGDPR